MRYDRARQSLDRHATDIVATVVVGFSRGDFTPACVALPRDVTIILVMTEVTLPLAEIKKRLSEIVDGVEGRHDRVVLTRNGRPAAVILSPDDLEALEDTLDLLSDPKAIRAIRKAEADIDAGKAVDAAALRAKYLKP